MGISVPRAPASGAVPQGLLGIKMSVSVKTNFTVGNGLSSLSDLTVERRGGERGLVLGPPAVSPGTAFNLHGPRAQQACGGGL